MEEEVEKHFFWLVYCDIACHHIYSAALCIYGPINKFQTNSSAN